jgi:hypothetical protein
LNRVYSSPRFLLPSPTVKEKTRQKQYSSNTLFCVEVLSPNLLFAAAEGRFVMLLDDAELRVYLPSYISVQAVEQGNDLAKSYRA